MPANTKPIVIFGTGDFAELAHFYFTRDAARTVEAFTVDRAYLKEERFCGLPVVAFEEVEKCYPPGDYEMFVAVGYKNMNRERKKKFFEAKAKKYQLATYLCSQSICWQNVKIGENCFIMEGNNFQPFSSIGNGVIFYAGNTVGHHATLRDFCFISGHTVVSAHVTVGEGCFLGIGTVLRNLITLGDYTFVDTGGLILKDTEEKAVYTSSGSEKRKISSDKIKIR